MAHFNYGRYLPALIESLRNQTLQGFGLIVVDDGSTDEGSVRVFDDLAQRFGSETWIFLRKPNGGIGETRNFAAARASTEFLVFMDADNLAEPRMVERMAACMGIFGGDALTCHMRGFSDSTSKSPLEIIYSYMPPGPCLEAGYLANVFGDANCIVRRTAFQKVRGFNEDRRSSFEDWELLARLALQCFRLDVIPEYLFLYRHTEQGFSRNTSPYLNHRRVLDAYHEALPSWAGRLIMSAFATNMVLQRLGMNRPANQPVSSLPAGKEFRALGLRYLKRYPTKPWRYNGPKLILAMAWYVTNQRCPSLQQRLKVVI